MKLRLTLVLGALALVASACGNGGQPVATVNGEAITAEYMASILGEGGQTLNVNTEEFRQSLSVEIVWAAVVPAAQDQFQLSVSDDDIAERIANPPIRYQALFNELAAQNATEEFVEVEAARTIWRDLVITELIRNEPGYIEDTITTVPQEVTAGCVRHILVDSQLEAEAALDRLAAGEEFTALADELSTDTVSGSNVVGGCPVGFGGFVAPFAFAASTAPLNEPFGPVPSEFGFHIIRVTDRRASGVRQFPDVQKEIRQKILAERRERTRKEYMTNLRESTPIWTAFDTEAGAATAARRSGAQRE